MASSTRLEEIAQRLAKATPGPWYSGTVQVYQTRHITRDVWNIAGPPRNTLHDNWENDRDFIAHTPTDIRFLLDALKARDALVTRLEEAGRFALMTLEHAQALGYLGEGSTMGMANDAIGKLTAALDAGSEGDER
jgi:hypothetical protein